MGAASFRSGRRTMKHTSLYQLYRLLKPEFLPRIGYLVGVVVLAAVTAIGLKAPMMLVIPLWNQVLFPPAEAAPVVPEVGALVDEGEQSRIQTRAYELAMDGFGATTEWVGGLIYGAEAGGADEQRLAALWSVALLMTVLTVIASIATYFQILLTRWIALRMMVDLRQRLAQHLVVLSMRYHSQRKFGDLLSAISADVNKTLQVVTSVLRDLVQEPMMIVTSIAGAAVIAFWPTMVFLLILPVAAVPIALLGRRVRKRSRKSLDKLGDSVEVLTQIFTGIRTVKAFRAEERELERYREVNEGYLSTSMKMVRAIGTIRATSHFLSYLGFTALLVLAGWVSIRYPVFGDPAALLAFLALVATIYNHTRRVTTTFNKVQESAGAADRLHALLSERIDISDAPDAVPARGLGAGVRFEGVTFSYPDGDGQAIAGVDIEIVPGEMLALVGPSGAGKSTFMDLLARFIDPDEGRVVVDGTDLRKLELASWTDQFAMVGQVPFLFHDTILENIRYGKPDATIEEIHTAARAAQIHEFIESLPQGYATPVGDVGARLSGGQRQRITIARAILKQAPLLLLDEATSALDSESEAEVQRALERLMIDRTVIVIAHRLSTIRNANRIAVLEAGRLVELGSHAELIEKNGLYARLFATQFPEDREVPVQ